MVDAWEAARDRLAAALELPRLDHEELVQRLSRCTRQLAAAQVHLDLASRAWAGGSDG